MPSDSKCQKKVELAERLCDFFLQHVMQENNTQIDVVNIRGKWAWTLFIWENLWQIAFIKFIFHTILRKKVPGLTQKKMQHSTVGKYLN